LATIAAWHVVCLAVLFVYEPTVGRVVVAAYTAWFGDIQASYGTFGRVAEYFGLLITTGTATGVSLWLSDVLSRQRPAWRRKTTVFAVWEAAAMIVLIWSYEVGFPYMIHELDWTVFGPVDDLYSFRNLVLHRIVAWVLCTTPIAWVALWLNAALACSASHESGPAVSKATE
jgi:hypothetical protein